MLRVQRGGRGTGQALDSMEVLARARAQTGCGGSDGANGHSLLLSEAGHRDTRTTSRSPPGRGDLRGRNTGLGR